MKALSHIALLLASVVTGSALAQTAPPTGAAAAPNDRYIGEVTSVDTEHRDIVLKQDKGAPVTITVGEKASVLRVPPGETDLKKATRITFADIGTGDRLLAVGSKSADKVEARTVVIMNKADIAQKQEREQQEWQKRSVSGVVAAIDPADKTMTITVGDKKYKVNSTPMTEFRRYAIDSAKYGDSKESAFPEIKVGDQISVLGNRNEEALTVNAERVVSGSFSRVAGTVSSVNAETGEIKLADLLGRRAVTVQVTPKSNARRIPEQLAALLAQRLVPAGQAGPTPAGGGRGGPAGGLRAGAGDLSQILERLPAIHVADLKPGSAVILMGSPQPDASHLIAITIVSGIEPIISAGANLVQDLIGGWSLGGGDLAEAQ